MNPTPPMQQPLIGAVILRSLFGTLLFVLIGSGTQAQTRTIINTEKAALEAVVTSDLGLDVGVLREL